MALAHELQHDENAHNAALAAAANAICWTAPELNHFSNAMML